MYNLNMPVATSVSAYDPSTSVVPFVHAPTHWPPAAAFGISYPSTNEPSINVNTYASVSMSPSTSIPTTSSIVIPAVRRPIPNSTTNNCNTVTSINLESTVVSAATNFNNNSSICTSTSTSSSASNLNLLPQNISTSNVSPSDSSSNTTHNIPIHTSTLPSTVTSNSCPSTVTSNSTSSTLTLNDTQIHEMNLFNVNSNTICEIFENILQTKRTSMRCEQIAQAATVTGKHKQIYEQYIAQGNKNEDWFNLFTKYVTTRKLKQINKTLKQTGDQIIETKNKSNVNAYEMVN
jgi:hypothetical protein